MSIEIKSDKEIKKLMKSNIAFHVCGLYEGEPLKRKLPDGRVVEFKVGLCERCKSKVFFVRGGERFGKIICTRCAVKDLEKHPDKEILGLVHEDDRKLYEMCEEKMIESEAKRRRTVAG